MRPRFTMRGANGVVSAVIVVFFLAHGVLGAVAGLTGFMSPYAQAVWLGVALVGVHVMASIATSVQQLTDTQRPPSARKKRHLALKWVTGLALGVLALAHVAMPKSSLAASVVIVVLSAALAVHVSVGAKSLLKDLGIDRRYMSALRIVVCVVAAALVVATGLAVAM